MQEDLKPIDWEIREVDLKDLKFYAKNPRTISKDAYERLNKNLQKFGLCQPIVVNQDLTIIGGHQRVKTLKKQGKKKAIISFPDRELDHRDFEELNIALNKDIGDWDYEVLANMWDVDDLIDYGFTDAELSIDSDVIKEAEEENKLDKYKITLEFVDKVCYDEAKKMCEHIATGHDGKIKFKG